MKDMNCNYVCYKYMLHSEGLSLSLRANDFITCSWHKILLFKLQKKVRNDDYCEHETVTNQNTRAIKLIQFRVVS